MSENNDYVINSSLDLLQRIALLTGYKHELNFRSANGIAIRQR